MEIGSMSGMQQGMPMDGMRRPKGPPPDAEKMSASIMEQQDTDGDGLLSDTELGIESDSDLLSSLDEDGDGFLSQTELQSGIQTTIDAMKAGFDSGTMPSTETADLMQQLHSLSGENKGNRSKGTQAYELMQQSMFGGSQDASSYNTDQMLLEQLNIAV